MGSADPNFARTATGSYGPNTSFISTFSDRTTPRDFRAVGGLAMLLQQSAVADISRVPPESQETQQEARPRLRLSPF